MDIVITYVNGLDPLWQKDYEQYTNIPILEKRFRDWGTLRYLLRGVEKNMPFIRKVHLIVARESQVPEWINQEKVHIVYHKDIIPNKYLPTFNSNTIEMFLHRISGLDEQFLYFNDDMFPVAPCQPEDFFRDGKAVIGFSKHLLALGMFKQICKNSNDMAYLAACRNTPLIYLRPQHICSPMFKTTFEEVHYELGSIIDNSLTRIRTKGNITQYVFLIYMYLCGKVINKKIPKKHFSTAIVSASCLNKFILNPTRKLMCINDVKLSDKRYNKLRATVLEAFGIRFPEKSKFEK